MNTGSPDLRNLGAQISASVREHPLGAALLGMGLVWLVGSSVGAPRAIGRVAHSAGDALSAQRAKIRGAAGGAGEALSAKAGAMGDTAAAAGQAVRAAAEDWAKAARDAASDAGDERGDTASDIADRGMDFVAPATDRLRDGGEQGATLLSGRIRSARERISQALDEEPLLLAAGGLAIGAAIAATLPVAGAARDG